MRNGLALWALGRNSPPDNVIRIFDCLGALPKMQFFSINQLDLEQEIELRRQKANSQEATDSNAKDGVVTTMPLDLAAMDLAAKRFSDGMRANAINTPRHHSSWDLVSRASISCAIPLNTFWYNFRKHWFTQNCNREDLGEYGADSDTIIEVFKLQGSTIGWRALLDR